MSAIAQQSTTPIDQARVAPGRGTEEAAATPGRGPLATYSGPDGRQREIVARRGAHGSVLVIDQRPDAGDRRLIAHLAADEPPDNAAIIARLYLADERGRHARPLSDADWFTSPTAPASSGGDQPPSELVDRHGRRYRIELVTEQRRGGQLRWTRRAPAGTRGRASVVSLRELVGALEAYEPARTISRRAVGRHPAPRSQVLRGELSLLERSPYVLNRAVREAVQQAVRDGRALSDIAAHCGHVRKRDCRAKGGDTSWLLRRIGLRPETPGGQPTVWLHADVLAVIARDGLGIDPRDVELA